MNPIPYTELPQNVFNPYVNTGPDGDWLEVVADTSPGSAGAAVDGQQEAVLEGWIPGNKIRSAMRWFLGFAYVDQATGALHRELPEFHPQFPQLYASSISFKGVAPLPIVGGSQESGLTLNAQSPFDAIIGYASYEKVVATVKFSPFRYQFYDDSQIPTAADEWYRYTYTDLEPKMEALSADGISQLIYAETSDPAPPAGIGPPNKKNFPAPIAVLLAKTGFVLNWVNVPVNYLSTNAYLFYPRNILSCVGKVNSDAFLGIFPPGTCLMEPPKFVQKPWWVPASDGTPMYAVDVSIQFQYFNPPNGYSLSTFAGHNLMPWSKDGLFYYATRDGTTSGTPLLASTAFNQVFSNPNF